MTKTGWTFFIGLPLIIIFIGYVSFTYLSNRNDIIVDTATSTVETSITSTRMVSVSTSTLYATVEGEYPQFANASVSFNKKIETAINAAIEDQFVGSKDNWNARVETASNGEEIPTTPSYADKFPLSFKTEIIRNDSKVISVVIYIDQFTGGAHGIQSILTFNYDLASQKEITIDTYIQNDVRFLTKLSVEARSILSKSLAEKAEVSLEEIDQDMLNDGTEPKVTNFSLFTIPNDTQLTFYFTQYQVAAYVYGSSEITVNLPLK